MTPPPFLKKKLLVVIFTILWLNINISHNFCLSVHTKVLYGVLWDVCNMG